MYKVLRVNKRYEFDLEGNVKRDGIEISDFGENGTLDIEIDDIVSKWCPRHLGLLAHYEVDLPLKDLNEIMFLGCNNRILRYRCGMLMVFQKPIIYKEGYRVIPGLTRYAISKEGVVISIISGKKISVRNYEDHYSSVTMYDADKGVYRSVYLHILLARAWLHNPNPDILLFVNHLNGKKNDHRLSNLEWVDSSSNVRHAKVFGLTADNIKCRTYDTVSRTFTNHMSLSDASVYVGNKRYIKRITNMVNGNIEPRLFNDRYFIIRPDSSLSDSEIVAIGDRGVILNKGPYEAMCTISNKIFEADTLLKLSETINVLYSSVITAFYSGPNYPAGKYLIRSKSKKSWDVPLEITVKNTPVSIQATNEKETKSFKSIREATQYILCDKTTITNRLSGKIKKPYQGWSFKEITINHSPLTRVTSK